MTKEYDPRYGGPFDRGQADAYYWRERNPHYFKGDSYSSELVEEQNMTVEELEAYNYGYDNNPERKQW
jgi:hypothetical protein